MIHDDNPEFRCGLGQQKIYNRPEKSIAENKTREQVNGVLESWMAMVTRSVISLMMGSWSLTRLDARHLGLSLYVMKKCSSLIKCHSGKVSVVFWGVSARVPTPPSGHTGAHSLNFHSQARLVFFCVQSLAFLNCYWFVIVKLI